MEKWRLAMSNDEKEPPPRNLKLIDEDGEDELYETDNNNNENDNSNINERDEEEEVQEEAMPVGEVVRVSGRGRAKKDHYTSFEFDGQRYELEDPVLLTPEGEQKPFVAIIKDVYQKNGDDGLMVTGQWFYRPEDVDTKGGGLWRSSGTNELFYSFHTDYISAGSVMHKCVVHFIPLNKHIPCRKEHPGFIVQKVYHMKQKRLIKLTDQVYEDNEQEELDVLVHKTTARIGVLHDIQAVDAEQEDHLKSKRLLKRKKKSNLDVSRDEDVMTKSGQSLIPEIPSVSINTSEYQTILSNFKALTGEDSRDKWLEKLLECFQFLCTPTDALNEDSAVNCADETQEKSARQEKNFWPDAVVPGVIALEKAAHEEFSSNLTKYRQKMRQLQFNLKNNSVLATRFVKGKLDASKIVSMTHAELKEGLTAEEFPSNQPVESAPMQMADTCCKRCSYKKVGVLEIIQAGQNARYQLGCLKCRYNWYASGNEVSTLTIAAPNAPKNVGTAPLATSKFENVEKILASPSESNKSTEEIFKKTTEAYMPVLETPRSFKK